MNILIAARLNSDYKLRTTLKPIIDIGLIDEVYLVRRYPIDLPKTKCYCPPGILRKFILTTEIYRLLTIFYLCLFKKVDCLMGIHFILHCVYTAIAKMIFRIPLIMLIIECPDKYKEHRLFNYFIRKADLIGVRGNYSREFISRTADVDMSKIFITPDLHTFDNSIEQGKNKKYDLAFVGYFTKAKRIDILLKVMDRLRKKLPNVKLVLIGQGPLKKMVDEHIDQLILHDNVIQLGYVESIYPYLSESKVFIMTSQTEGLPTVLLEAMGCQLPFIVPDVGDIKDLAIDRYNAIVVERLDIDQFVDACYELLTNEDTRQQYIDNTQILLKEKKKIYTYENVQAVWNEQLKRLFHEE